MRLFLIILKNLRRNLLRTTLTCLALFVLVFIVTLIWSFLDLFDRFTEAKAGEQKAIVTERWQFPSMMPQSYEAALQSELERLPPEHRPTGYMPWSFYGGSLDPNKRTPENSLFMFVMRPDTLTMLDEWHDPGKKLETLLQNNTDGILIGREKLASFNKKVGDTIKVTSMNFKGIDLEFKILAVLPSMTGRYDQSAIMNQRYLLRALDQWKSDRTKGNGSPHPMADKCLALFWFQSKSLKSIDVAAERLEAPGKFTQPSVKCETASSGIASFIEPYRDLLWGMRWLLTPAILVVMALVIANAISITVRERRTEMAVMKVLGFRPGQILMLVLGEVLLLGALTGFLCTGLTYTMINLVMGGVKFPVAFFPAFKIPAAALWWGPAIGGGTAFVGSLLPSLSARSIKVSEVFAKVA
jgi:putative ABC transport system permease protein